MTSWPRGSRRPKGHGKAAALTGCATSAMAANPDITASKQSGKIPKKADLLFVLSRWVGKHLGETEYLWERGLASHARKR